MKYRICKNEEGEYKVQERKFFIFWFRWEDQFHGKDDIFDDYHGCLTIIFKSRKEAEQYIQYRLQKDANKRKAKWHCDGVISEST